MKRLAMFCISFLSLAQCYAGPTTVKYYTGSYWDYRGWTWKNAAVRFTVPSDSSYQLNTLSMRLCGDPTATLLDVTIWQDNAGSMGSTLYILSDQNWNQDNINDQWNQYDLSSAHLIFAPGESFYGGYTSDAAEYADVGIFVDDDVDFGRSSGINIHYGTDWRPIDGELFFEVTLTAIPVPGAFLLACLGACSFIRFRKRIN